MPGIHAYGGRGATFDVFKTALENCDADTYPILLVDSEEPVEDNGIDPHSDIAWSHLESHDHWARPEGWLEVSLTYLIIPEVGGVTVEDG